MRKRGRGRKRSFRFGGGLAARDLAMYSVETLSNANYYIGPNPSGDAGDAAVGFGGALIFRPDVLIAAGSRYLYNRITFAPLAGYVVDIDGANIRFVVINGAAGAVIAPQYALVAGDVDAYCHVAWQFDQVASKVRLYVHSGEVANGTAIVGFSPATTAARIGRSITGSGASDVAIPGVVTWTGLATPAEIVAHREACIASSDIANFASAAATQSHRWSVKNDQTGTAPATLTDLTGSDNLSSVGAPTLRVDAAPVFS